MTLFKNKYRIESIRKWNWNYSAPAFYFVTICTQYKRLYFGNVKNDAMQLSEIGSVAEAFWKEIPKHHKDVELDEFIVMPNHVHGIIGICGPEPEFKLLSRKKETIDFSVEGLSGRHCPFLQSRGFLLVHSRESAICVATGLPRPNHQNRQKHGSCSPIHTRQSEELDG